MLPLIRLSESIQIPTFYLVLSLALCVCLFWLVQRTRQFHLDLKISLDAALVLMLSALIGSRLFHVFYENPEIYREHPLAIFYIWNGGFVFYGGAFLCAFTGFLFARWRTPRQIGQYFDLYAPLCSLAYAIGRWGCFFAGCCYGRACDLPWAFHGRHPTQIYASFWELGALSLLLAFEKRPDRKPGQVFSLWLILHASGRIMMESLRGDFRGPVFLFSISTWFSLGVLVLGLYLFRDFLLRKR